MIYREREKKEKKQSNHLTSIRLNKRTEIQQRRSIVINVSYTGQALFVQNFLV